MLSTDAIEKAAAFLVEARRARRRIDAIPDALAPQTYDEGFAIDEAMRRMLGVATAGWKAGFTSPAAIQRLKLERTLFVRLTQDQVVASPASVPAARFHAPMWEIEVAFRIGTTLQPRAQPFSRAEVLAATAAAHLCFEIPDGRFTNSAQTPLPCLIANSFSTECFVTGPEIPRWREIDLAAFPVELVVNGKTKAEAQKAENRADPLQVLIGVANGLRERGIALEAGLIVTTGSASTVIPAEPGDRAVGRIPGGPEVRAELTR
jgi:2-keto-4-pentenoate hydratase